jgi:energy-coupling factor transporter ATP-binding protein EcfA2
MNDLPSPLGWVELIEMDSCRLFKSMPKLKLSRFTLVCGMEGSGKSLLFEMAASISNSQYGERLINLSNSSHTKGTITYSTVDHHEIKLRLDFSNSNLHRYHNNTLLNIPPSDIEIIYYPSQIRGRFTEEDDLLFLMRILAVDKSALKTMCSDLGSNTLIKGEFYFEQSKSQDEDNGTETSDVNGDGTPLLKLICKLDGRDFSLPFNSLSQSEKLRIVMSFFIIKAREISKHKLTLLILETDSINFDEKNFKKLLNVLLEQPFQVVLNVPNARYTNVIDVDELGNPSLKSHDYLERWSLARVESEKI